ARSRSLESRRTNIHPTAAAVASLIPSSLSMPKSSMPQSSRKSLSTATSAAMTPQNRPLDFLKTLSCFVPWRGDHYEAQTLSHPHRHHHRARCDRRGLGGNSLLLALP